MKCIYCGHKLLPEQPPEDNSCESCEAILDGAAIDDYEIEDDEFDISTVTNSCGRILPVRYDDGYEDQTNW